jgi:CubicO group peptidase (beta-lactamase class C family)
MSGNQELFSITSRRSFLGGAASLAGLSLFNRLVKCRELPQVSQPKTIDYSSVIARFKERLPGLMTQYKIPGMAMALVDGDKVVWAEGLGYTDRSHKVKVTDETLFSLQSISKTYTALGTLMSIDRGRLKLDDKLRKHLPKFRINTRFGRHEVEKITIRNLLTHRAGLCHEAPLGNNYDNCQCTFADHIRSISDSWLVAPVEQRFSYSNLGIDLAGYVLQLRSGASFEQLMKRDVLGPLAMTASTFSQKEAFAHPSVAAGHIGDDEIPKMFIPMIPSGGMYSSVKDMARFISFQLEGGRVNGRRLISDALLREMTTPQYPVSGQVGGYGLGVYNVASFGATKLLHSGGGYGYSADQRWIPEYKIGAVVLTNQSRDSLAASLANRALELMIEAKLSKVPQTKPISFTSRPGAAPASDVLLLLTGSYKAGDMVTFTVEEGRLLYISGSKKLTLERLGRLEFFYGSRRYVFDCDEKTKARGVLVIDPDYSSNGAEYWPLNDTPSDPPGPDREAWRKHVGSYVGTSYGREVKTDVLLKNGYLYVSRGGGLRLQEYKPDLFFTTEGEAVLFRAEAMLLGNRPYRRKVSPG